MTAAAILTITALIECALYLRAGRIHVRPLLDRRR